MFCNRDDSEMRRLIVFYIICTNIYFPLIFLILYWSDGIYSVGKYNFKFFLMIIALAEIVKYVVGVHYWKNNYLNLMKKNEDLPQSFIKNIFNRSRIKEGCKNIFTVCSMIIVYYIFTVLYGAEILDKHEETLMFSALLSTLTILPSCVNLGSPSIISILLGYKAKDRLESLMYQNFYLTLFGAWLGAFVIPLDWDRPWQQWPISCSYGAMFGFITSHIIMAFHIKSINLKKKNRLL